MPSPPAPPPSSRALLAGALVGLLPLALGLVPGDEAARLERVIGGYGLAGLAYLGVLRGWRRLPGGRRGLLLLLGIAVGVRLLLLLLPPLLSEDVWRYIWDGATQWHGHNPYRHAPDAAALDPMALDPALAAVRARIGHAHIPTIYPPAAQLTFAALSPLGPSPVWLRLAFIAADGVAIAALWRWARHLGRPPQLAALFAFAPPAVLEGALGGHLDALGVAAMVVAGCWLGRRPIAAGVALGVSVATKLLPVLVAPVLLRRHRGALVVAGLTVAALALPYLGVGREMLSGLGAYGARWRANDGLFALLVHGFEHLWPPGPEPLEVAEPVRRLVRALVGPGVGDDPRLIWPDELAFAAAKGVALASFGAVWLWCALRARSFADMLGPAIVTLLLVSPVVHPWYLLWALPFCALAAPERRWPWPILLWSTLVFLAYLPRPAYLRTGAWTVDPRVVALQYAPVWIGLAIVATRAVQRLRSR